MRPGTILANSSACRVRLLPACLLAIALLSGCRKNAFETAQQTGPSQLDSSATRGGGQQFGLPIYPGGPAHYTLYENTINETLASMASSCANVDYPDAKPDILASEVAKPAHVFTLRDPVSGGKRIYNANDASVLVALMREQYDQIRQPEPQMDCLHDLTEHLDHLTQSAVETH